MKKVKKFVYDTNEQELFDHFNSFMFSTDTKLIGKLQSKYFFCQLTENLLGDIVELGVFKGFGLIAWLKTLKHMKPGNKSVIGFDSFDHISLLDSIKTSDKETMKLLFKDRNFNSFGYETKLIEILKNIGFGDESYQLITGNVLNTMEDFLNNRPGFRASIVNFDLDLEEPTEYALNLLWNRVVKGGVMIFDEYGIHKWTESNAVDRFVEQHSLSLIRTPWFAPTAYVVKS